MGLEVLIIGKSAREHAISYMYEKSDIVESIIVAPGNDFMAYKRKKSVSIDKKCSLKDPKSILGIANKYSPDLIDIAQDDALAAGTVDILESNGFTVFGPIKKASRIEWDKKWSREFMKKYDIPTPFFNSFNSEELAINYVKKLYSKEPKKIVYVKATGLCGERAR